MEPHERSAVQPFLQPFFEKNPKLGCGLAVGLWVALGCFAVSMCSGGNDEHKTTAETESPAEARLRQEKNEAIDARVDAEQNLRATLKDGDSAEFKDMFVSRIQGGNLMLCGKVNAKNAFGAYTGFERFIASPNPSAPSIIEGEATGLSRSQFQQAYSSVCTNPVMRF
ncbi:hypothetical protein [Sphingobium chlorophenolicum]|uniref:hypothetical protein n=1 Tax=Sphingobium chlorophenolicum TaxID=46429 RepID=UPI00117DDE47|nr:hypothetical protein [Sphingobium chlorophenolicum]